MEPLLLCILLIILFILCYIMLQLLLEKRNKKKYMLQQEDQIRLLQEELKKNQEFLQQNMQYQMDVFTTMQKQSLQLQETHLNELMQQLDQNQNLLYRSVKDALANIQSSLHENTLQSAQKLEQIRQAVEERLRDLQTDNGKKLDEMRHIVDEKLQKTLEERISKSFTIVSQRLEQVYKGLGEMQTLAVGVGDLKKVLSNVKTRGILGEIQLGAILEEILSPEQYDCNVITKKGSNNFVEFAVKLPADDDKFIYLPIDSKFPGETYAALVDAYEEGDSMKISQCVKQLESTIKQEAKQIHDKYIDIPNTTEFAVLFLPFEGLYAEVVKRGMVEVLQREYKVNIAGPTTMAALLNSLQMGFKTLAIQKRSSEVWDVLGAVKTEFNKFGEVLEGTQMKMEQAQKELDKLVGVRTRQIQRKLKEVGELDMSQTDDLLEDAS